MSLTGPPDGFGYKVGVAIADLAAGLFAAQGTLLALYARERNGLGQHVDIAMLDSVAALLTYQAGIYFVTGAPPKRHGNAHPTVAPYETFQAADGDVVLAAGNDDLWRKFCAIAGLDAVRGGSALREESRPREATTIRSAPSWPMRSSSGRRPKWLDLLNDAGIPAGPVRNLHEVLNDEQLLCARHGPRAAALERRCGAGAWRPGKVVDHAGRCTASRRRRSANIPKQSWPGIWGVPSEIAAMRTAGVV